VSVFSRLQRIFLGNGKYLSRVCRMETEKPGAIRVYWHVGEDKTLTELEYFCGITICNH